MKIRFLIPLIASLWMPLALTPVIIGGAGCATAEQTAYRSIGTVDITVHNAMLAWGNYVRDGRATPDEVLLVGQYYEKYQAAMGVAHAATRSVAGAPPDQTKLKTALNAAMDSVGELTTLIAALTRK